MKALHNYIAQFPHYTPQVFEDLAPFLTIQHIESGEYFLKQDKICKNLAFIEEGLLRLYYLNDGKEVTTCFCFEDTITCSYKSMITNSPSEIAIQAVEPCKLVVFSYEALKSMYDKNLFWQQVGRLAAENEYLNTECHNRFLNDLSATEKYKQIMIENPEIIQRAPLNYIASYMQIAPETLSRIRKKIIRT